MHRPATAAEAELGRRRLAFDELLDLQLMLIRARTVAKRQPERAWPSRVRRDLTTRLRESLPWELTDDQQRALREITGDMTAPDRMHRLLMGDVGTGKTVVALFAMLLARGERLPGRAHGADRAPGRAARSHARAAARAARAPARAAARPADRRREAGGSRAARGGPGAAGGRHPRAACRRASSFHRLGLVVIDEQHRFGVEQRAALIGKGAAPDVLLLTATPIPRSLALTLYGDLDVSTLRQRPPGRGHDPHRGPDRRHSASGCSSSCATECGRGRQAYVVLPVIEESERADLRAATTMAQSLAARWPELRGRAGARPAQGRGARRR